MGDALAEMEVEPVIKTCITAKVQRSAQLPLTCSRIGAVRQLIGSVKADVVVDGDIRTNGCEHVVQGIRSAGVVEIRANLGIDFDIFRDLRSRTNTDPATVDTAGILQIVLTKQSKGIAAKGRPDVAAQGRGLSCLDISNRGF